MAGSGITGGRVGEDPDDLKSSKDANPYLVPAG
jgi:hypothetical protein